MTVYLFERCQHLKVLPLIWVLIKYKFCELLKGHIQDIIDSIEFYYVTNKVYYKVCK